MLPMPRSWDADGHALSSPFDESKRGGLLILAFVILVVPVALVLLQLIAINVLAFPGTWYLMDPCPPVTVDAFGRVHVPDGALGEFGPENTVDAQLVVLSAWPPHAATLEPVGHAGRLHLMKTGQARDKWLTKYGWISAIHTTHPN